MNMAELDRGVNDWPVQIASAVVLQAISDLHAHGTEKGAGVVWSSAVEFLFGPDNHVDGWIGILGVEREYLRRKVLKHLETESALESPEQNEGESKSAYAQRLKRVESRRNKAHLALSRIRKLGYGR